VCSSAFVAEFRKDVSDIIRDTVERLEAPQADSYVRLSALELLSDLGVQGMRQHAFLWVYSCMFVAESRENVQIIIRAVAERLEDADYGVCLVAIGFFSRLAEQGMC